MARLFRKKTEASGSTESFTLSELREMEKDRQAILRHRKIPPDKSYVLGYMPLKREGLKVAEAPSFFLAEAEKIGLLSPEGGRALDFSSGLGRNAFYLMKRGFDVLSVAYPDEECVLHEKWRERHFQEKWAEQYAEKFRKCGRFEVLEGSFQDYALGDDVFDVVVCTNSLFYASYELSQTVIRDFQDRTQQGGLNIITTWNADDVQPLTGRRWGMSPDHFITSGRGEDDALQLLYPQTGWIRHEPEAGCKHPWSWGIPWSFKPGKERLHSVVMATKK